MARRLQTGTAWLGLTLTVWLGVNGFWPAGAEARGAKTTDLAGLLKTADACRGGGGEGLTYDTDVHIELAGAAPTDRSFSVTARGTDTLAVAKAPPERAGDRVLVTGGQVWQRPRLASMPNLVKPSDRMAGLAMVGDLGATYFGFAYGKGKLTAPFTAELTPSKDGALYARVLLALDPKTGCATQAEYYDASGAKLRTATFAYANDRPVKSSKSAPFLSSMSVVDHTVDGFKATVTYHAPAAAAVGDTLTFKHLHEGP